MSATLMNQVIGIDGCRSGWCVAIIAHGKMNIEVYPHLTDCLELLSHSEVNLIDMPIGLADTTVSRDIDLHAKTILGAKRASSIFIPPCRRAIQVNTYQQSLSINRDIMGKGFSIQAWNICPKILEVDDLLHRHEDLKPKLLESHPEITFQYLNGSPLLHKKKTPEGQAERLNIISRWHAPIKDIYNQTLKETLRKHLAKDDIIDAMGLAVAAQLSLTHGLSAVGSNKTDSAGITMNIHYVLPHV